MRKIIFITLILISSLYASKDQLVLSIMENAGVNYKIDNLKTKLLNYKGSNKSVEKFSELYYTEEIKQIIYRKLVNQMSLKELKYLDKWYKTKLLQKIKKANELVISKELAKKIINDTSTLRSKKHIFTLADIDKVLKYSSNDFYIMEKQVVSFIKKHPNVSLRPEVILYKKDKKLLKTKLRNQSIGFLAYKYKDISTNDLNKYADFLFTKQNVKFLNISQQSLFNYVDETFELFL